MLEIIKFTPEHWDDIREQDATKHLRLFVNDEYVRSLANSPYCYTAVSGKEIVAIGGIMEHWPGRAEVWAELAGDVGNNFIAIHKAASRCLEVCPYDRIEATIEVGFKQAHRWARMLGFKQEAKVMRKFGIDGKDYSMYAKVR